jgi:predicted GTPase
MLGDAATEFTFENEQHRSAELATGLRRMADAFAPVAVLQREVADLRIEAQHVEDGRFSIVVLGAFNRGKSTLLNAMVGNDGLPVAAIPATAIISVLRYGQREKALVYLLDGSTQGPMTLEEFKKQFVLDPIETVLAASPAYSANSHHNEEVDANDLEDSDPEEQDRRRLQMARDRFSPIDYSEIILDCDLLRHGVEFVDPPGFEDDDTRTKRAREFLYKADAVIYVLDATMPVTEADVTTLDWIASLGQRAVFFVINKWNILELMERTPAGRRKVEQRFQSKLKKYLPEAGEAAYARWVFKVNALDAFDARQSHPVDKAKLSASGLPQFEQVLEHFLVERRIEARDRALLAKATTVCRVVSNQLQRMQHISSQTLTQLNAKKAAIAPKLEQLRTIRRHIGDFIESHLITTQKNIADRLNQHMVAVDTTKLMGKLNLNILGTWFALEALNDFATSQFEKTFAGFGGVEVDESKRYPARVRTSIEPQIERFLREEFLSWEISTANPGIQEQAAKMIKYLREEALDFSRVLDEIAQILSDESSSPFPINVEALVNDWVRERSVHQHSYGALDIGGLGGIALDLTPMIGSVLAEVALHLKGAIVPFVGTIVTVAFSVWRNKKTKEKLRFGIKEGLHKAFAEIPNATQRAAIDKTLAEQFGREADDQKPLSQIVFGEAKQTPLRRRILGNIDEQISMVERQLEDAIDAVNRGEDQHKAERNKLQSIEVAVNEELKLLLANCGPISK